MGRSPAYVALVLAVVLIALSLASSAQANLRSGSHNSLSTGSGSHRKLAMPLPKVLRPPTLHRADDGTVTVTTQVGYVASNWQRKLRVRQDRALVTLNVARRLFTTGPDPANPIFSKIETHLLRQRRAAHTYITVLPRRVAAVLSARGAFSADPKRAERARRLVWADIEQDRDYQRVDGRYDWREGRAANAADKPDRRPQLSRSRAHGASEESRCKSATPCGTLTVQNQTSAGVYCPGCDWSSGAGNPGSAGATANQTGVPIVVGGSAIQCFESGSAESNPTGFANTDSSGNPQGYAPGSVSSDASDPNGFASSGTAVTEPVQANDTAEWATNDQVADASGLVQGVMGEAVSWGGFALNQLGVNAAGGGVYSPGVGGLAMVSMGESSLPIPSPGAIVSAGLDIAEFVIDNSCDGNANLMALGVAEPGGGLAASALSFSKEGFGPYTVDIPGATPGTSNSQAYGVQMAPSQNIYNGSPMYLNQLIGGGGVQGNIAGGSGTDFIDVAWTNYSPCQVQVTGEIDDQADPGIDSCNVTPTGSPTVTSSVGNVNCGTGNTDCPFAAANFPAGTATSFDTTPFALSQPSGTPVTTLKNNNCATALGTGQAIASGQSISSPNGLFTLAMNASGALTLTQNSFQGIASAQLWNASGSGPAGSYAAMQTAGNFVVLDPAPSNTSTFASNTNNNGNAYLALQNDGNLVVYSLGGNALWASGTQVATCTSPGPASAPTSSSAATTASGDGKATILAGGVTEYLANTTITSPNGQTQLIMNSNGNLYAYHNGTQVWQSNDIYQNPPAGTGTFSGIAGSYFVMQADGNLAVYSPTGSTVEFASNTSGNQGAYLAVEDNGNVAVYDASGNGLWATGTGTGPAPSTSVGDGGCTTNLAGGQALYNGQQIFSPNGNNYLSVSEGTLVLVNNSGDAVWRTNSAEAYGNGTAYMQPDGNLVFVNGLGVTVFNSGTSGTPGAYLAVQNDGNMVIYAPNGAVLWATNTVQVKSKDACPNPG